MLDFIDGIEKKYKADPFSKVTIKLSEKDFMTQVNDVLVKNIKLNIAVEDLSGKLFISKSTLDKRIRKLTEANYEIIKEIINKLCL